jgi:hypothetical protein
MVEPRSSIAGFEPESKVIRSRSSALRNALETVVPWLFLSQWVVYAGVRGPASRPEAAGVLVFGRLSPRGDTERLEAAAMTFYVGLIVLWLIFGSALAVALYGVALTAKDLDATQRAKAARDAVEDGDEDERRPEEPAKDVREAAMATEKAASDEEE